VVFDQRNFEQVTVSRLLEIAWDEFDKSLLSVGARYVLWGSFSDESSLAESYFRAKGKVKLIDGRRTENSRTPEENHLVDLVNSAANDISEYLKWAKNNGNGQPILREALVGYCIAFEACLKNVAVAFLLAKSVGLNGVAFIPNGEFKKAFKSVKDGWRNAEIDGKFRGKVFYENFLINENPKPDFFTFSMHLDSDHWSDCWAAFDLRNAIVHQMGRLDEQVTLDDTVFSPNHEIEIKPKNLYVVANSMREVLGPLDPLLPL
jgi:hypothetical protein